jgi:hypothetical protein
MKASPKCRSLNMIKKNKKLGFLKKFRLKSTS